MQTRPAKLLGFWDLLGISLGQIIGTGVVVLTGISISMTGYGTPWAFGLALLIVSIPTICIAALGSAVPSNGGNYTYVRDLLGPRIAIVYLGLLVAGQIILASFAIGFGEYAQALWPGLSVKWTAAFIMSVCFIANLLGLKTAARFQNLMVIVLITALLAYIIAGLGEVEDFGKFTTPERVFPKGFGGFFAAAFLLRLSLVGSEYVSEFGHDMKRPGQTIPLVMGASLLIVTLLYIGIAIVATGVLPLEAVIGKNLSVTAREIFSPPVYVAFIGGGILLSLVTSLNAIFAWCTKGLCMATQDGWLPGGWAKANRFGVAWKYLSVFYLVGLVPILAGLGLKWVSVFGNAVGAIFGLFPVFALWALANKRPEEWRAAPFRLPLWATKVFPLLSVLIYGYGVYTSWGFVGNRGWAALAVYTAVLVIFALLRRPRPAVAPVGQSS
ncbi:MAG TPA: amino acid permease [Hellea balneolensis]|uniref:Amino acid permease n=1 Tax=Hellea balneolensis TaxID=287478 RepID=A0A7V5NWP5_9PROT|nr:amino acid permease [Hellea balneolensis]